MQYWQESFCENICSFRSRRNVIDKDTVVLEAIANEMVTNIDMFSALMVGRICGDCESALVV